MRIDSGASLDVGSPKTLREKANFAFTVRLG